MSRKKGKSTVVQTPKSDKDRMRIVISAETMNRLRRTREREDRKEAGNVMGVSSRCGVHGGGKREIARRDRKAGRQQMKRYQQGGGYDE